MRSFLIFLCRSYWGFWDPPPTSLSLSHTHTSWNGCSLGWFGLLLQKFHCADMFNYNYPVLFPNFPQKTSIVIVNFQLQKYSLALPNKGDTLKWCRVHLVPHFEGYSPGGGNLWTIRSFLGAVTKHSSPGGTVWTVSLVFGNFCGTL
jgi:hypothetical protein